MAEVGTNAIKTGQKKPAFSIGASPYQDCSMLGRWRRRKGDRYWLATLALGVVGNVRYTLRGRCYSAHREWHLWVASGCSALPKATAQKPSVRSQLPMV
jgi:hypothetical protein